MRRHGSIGRADVLLAHAEIETQPYDAKDLGFRLKPGAAAVDRGVALPNVTDGFAGRAPDLGAIELGLAAPHYGPRR